MIGENKKFHKLYSGTKDGFDPEDFHKKCDKKGATISIIKTSDKKVFGGYTPIPWESSG